MFILGKLSAKGKNCCRKSYWFKLSECMKTLRLFTLVELKTMNTDLEDRYFFIRCLALKVCQEKTCLESKLFKILGVIGIVNRLLCLFSWRYIRGFLQYKNNHNHCKSVLPSKASFTTTFRYLFFHSKFFNNTVIMYFTT